MPTNSATITSRNGNTFVNACHMLEERREHSNTTFPHNHRCLRERARGTSHITGNKHTHKLAPNPELRREENQGRQKYEDDDDTDHGVVHSKPLCDAEEGRTNKHQ